MKTMLQNDSQRTDTQNIHDNHGYSQNTDDRYNKNNKTMIAAIAGGAALVIILLILFLGKQNHYENGVKYLQNKQYTEALVEFQRVDPDEDEFQLAQSKINYINGIQAYNSGQHQQAKVFLQKVIPSDEYYNESQLIIEKINLASKQGDLERLSDAVQSNNKDTLIIREEVVEKSSDNVREAEPVGSNDQISRSYAIGVMNMISKFQSFLQNAERQEPSAKILTMKNMDSLYKELNQLPYNATEKSAVIVELKTLVSNWMQKSMSYLNSLSTPNSVSNSSDIQQFRRESDDAYKRLISHLDKVKVLYSL